MSFPRAEGLTGTTASDQQAEDGVRRLAAILAMDVVGYSRMMEADEGATLNRIRWLRESLVAPRVVNNRGRIFKTMGDGLLAEFSSAADAVICALELQRALIEEEGGAPAGEKLRVRMGIHIGDIVSEGTDVLGDGVNIAARLEAIAEPGTIFVSRGVRDSAGRAGSFHFENLGERQVKNIQRPIQVFRVVPESEGSRMSGRLASQRKAHLRAVVVPVIVAALAVLAIFVAWRVGGELTSDMRGRIEPWSALDPRETFAILPPTLTEGGPELHDYAKDFIDALSNRFASSLGDAKLVDYPPPAQGGQHPTPHFLIEFSAHRSGNDVAVAIVERDVATGETLASRVFTEPLGQHLDPERTQVWEVSRAIKEAASRRERQDSEAKPADERDARDFVILAGHPWTKREDADRTISFLETANRLAPDHPQVMGQFADLLFERVKWGWADDPTGDRARALEFAQRTLAQWTDDISSYLVEADIYSFDGNWSNVITVCDHVLAINGAATYAKALKVRGLLASGRVPDAIALIDPLIPLVSKGMTPELAGSVGLTRFAQGRYAEAADFLRKAVLGLPPQRLRNGADASLLPYLASAEALRGNQDAAVMVLQQFRDSVPEVKDIATFSKWWGRNNLPSIEPEQLLSGLRTAGLAG